MSNVARAVESGATTIRGIVDATGLSRLRIERALHALEKQKLIVRDGDGKEFVPTQKEIEVRAHACNVIADLGPHLSVGLESPTVNADTDASAEEEET